MDPVLEVAIHLSEGDKGPHNPDMELRYICIQLMFDR